MRRPNKYLDELISYGGQPFTRAEVIADMQRDGTPQLLIDRWLQSQEHAARRHAQHRLVWLTPLFNECCSMLQFYYMLHISVIIFYLNNLFI